MEVLPYYFEPTVKLETLASGNIGEFGESGSNRQTYTYQSKVTKQNKRL